MKLIGVLTLVLAMLLSAGASAAPGDTWSCAKSRWGGSATLQIFPDRTMVYAADGYPMVAVRDGSVTVHCNTSTDNPVIDTYWSVTNGPLWCAIPANGPVVVMDRVIGGTEYIVLQQGVLEMYRIARDRSTHAISEDGCPPPPPSSGGG